MKIKYEIDELLLTKIKIEREGGRHDPLDVSGVIHHRMVKGSVRNSFCI